jgi:serine/threonine-protein kinase
MTEAQVGEKDSALTHIEQALAAPVGHALSVASLRFDPRWNPIRDDPRFKALLTKYGVDGKGAGQ